MKLIPLTRGLFAQVDDEDFEFLSQWRWHANLKPYAVCGVDAGSGTRTSMYMHRLIMSPTGKDVVDHIDGDSLNNTRSNLRICTHAENLRNRGPAKPAKLKRKQPANGMKKPAYWAVLNTK